jgi:hypothetical protein
MTAPELPEPAEAERFRKALDYDKASGEFRWRVARGPMKAGTVAGSPLGPYFCVGVFKKTHLAHRLAVLLVTGSWPEPGKEVDHKDGDKRNNAWNNLRVVSKIVNTQNLRKAAVCNTSGLIGAHWNAKYNRWQSAIRVNKTNVYLGKFDSAESAHEAYIAAKRRFHEGCTI